MTTLVTASPEEAASFIHSGEVVAFPTETVYGLGADALDERSVSKIFAAKGRPSDNPLIVHISSIEDLEVLVRSRTEVGDRLIEHFFPGPLTVILEKSPDVPAAVTAGLKTIGIRMPDHPVASTFLKACARPVAAPSANRSGRPSPTSWQAVLDDLGGRIPCILEGGRSVVGLESTVVDCTTSPPAILRAGAVSAERLRAVIPEISIAVGNDENTPRSPGVRHRHYAPQARVEVVDHPPSDSHTDAAYIGIDPPTRELGLIRVCSTVEEYAHELFEFFRLSDSAGIKTIFCQRVREEGLGLALMDRLFRASQASGGHQNQ